MPRVLFCAVSLQAAELRSVTLGSVAPNLRTQLPIAVAQQAGFFNDDGLQVHGVTIVSGGTLMVAILTSGHADLVVSGVAATVPGNPETQRKALDYFAQDLDVQIERDNIAALLNALGIKGEPERFFDRSFLTRSFAGH